MNGRFFGACFLFGCKKRSYRSITNLFFGDFATAPFFIVQMNIPRGKRMRDLRIWRILFLYIV